MPNFENLIVVKKDPRLPLMSLVFLLILTSGAQSRLDKLLEVQLSIDITLFYSLIFIFHLRSLHLSSIF